MLWYMDRSTSRICAEVFGTERMAAKVAAGMTYTNAAYIMGVQYSTGRTAMMGSWQVGLEEKRLFLEAMQGFQVDEKRISRLREVKVPFPEVDLNDRVYIRDDLPEWAGA